MPTTPNVRATDDLADQFKRILQRLASLERAVSTGSGGGATGTDEVWIGTSDPIVSVPTIELWYDTDEPGAPTSIVTFTPVRRGGGAVDGIGTGGQSWGTYQIIGGACFFVIFYQFGSSGASANAGLTTFDAPVPFGSIGASFQPVGSGLGVQAGARFNFQVIRDASNNGFQLYAPAQVYSNVPGQVTFNDAWRFSGWYWV